MNTARTPENVGRGRAHRVTLGGVTALTGGILLTAMATAGTAHASTPMSPGPDWGKAGAVTTATAPAPSCLVVHLKDSGFTDHLTVTNQCDDPERVKVVLANFEDLACQTIRATDSHDYKWAYPGRFDRLESC